MPGQFADGALVHPYDSCRCARADSVHTFLSVSSGAFVASSLRVQSNLFACRFRASSLRSDSKANTGWMCGSLQVPHGAHREPIRHFGGSVCGLNGLFGTSS